MQNLCALPPQWMHACSALPHSQCTNAPHCRIAPKTLENPREKHYFTPNARMRCIAAFPMHECAALLHSQCTNADPPRIDNNIESSSSTDYDWYRLILSAFVNRWLLECLDLGFSQWKTFCRIGRYSTETWTHAAMIKVAFCEVQHCWYYTCL